MYAHLKPIVHHPDQNPNTLGNNFQYSPTSTAFSRSGGGYPNSRFSTVLLEDGTVGFEERQAEPMTLEELVAKLDDRKSILSKERGRKIFSLIAFSDEGMTIREIQENTGYKYARTYNTLNRLEEEQLVAHLEGEQIRPGVKPTYIYHLNDIIDVDLKLLRREIDSRLPSQEDIRDLLVEVPLPMDVLLAPALSERSTTRTSIVPPVPGGTMSSAELSEVLPDEWADTTPWGTPQHLPVEDFLAEQIKNSKPLTKLSYLRILKEVEEVGSVSMNGLSQKFGLPTQHIHNRLICLLELNILNRTRESNEYRYELANPVDLGRLTALLQESENDMDIQFLSSNQANDAPTVSLSSSAARVSPEVTSGACPARSVPQKNADLSFVDVETNSAPSMITPGQIQQASPVVDLGNSQNLTERLASKLPDFDANWNDEMKERWLASFASLVELTKSSHSEPKNQ